MPSQTKSTPLTVTVLAALWVSLGRCGVSEPPVTGCDNGKLFLDRDLLLDDVFQDCQGSSWPKSAKRLPSIDTVYDPVPVGEICMDKSISYSHTIPSSGAYRPVRAESGEYLYCPPQRWLNNLHHGATVLLYHPCAPLHERLLLSALARSCLPDFILSSHPQLSVHMPIAFVSWAHTLELSTVASSELCDWLETHTSIRNKSDVVSQSKKYNLLLTWSAEQHRQHQAHPEERSAKMKESLRQCCEQTISSLLMETELESNMKKESMKLIKEEGTHSLTRAVREAAQDESERENTVTQEANRTIISRTGEARNYSALGPSADSPQGNKTLSDHPGPGEAPSQSKIQNINQGLTSRPTTPLASNKTVFRSVNNESNNTARPEALARNSKDEDTDPAKLMDQDSPTKNVSKDKKSDKDNTAGGTVKDSAFVDVKEREFEHKQTHSGTHSHQKSDKIAIDSVSKSQSESPHEHQNPQPASYLPNSHDCDSCKAGEHCDCNKDSGASAAAGNTGLPRTPRTDEAVWAAAALGFLLILLTLSVLHTRLYRHWRTTPSLYWHDPQQDYDSVADVIRRRLRIANRRRKRGRRQECVLLPSSSSSDEHP